MAILRSLFRKRSKLADTNAFEIPAEVTEMTEKKDEATDTTTATAAKKNNSTEDFLDYWIQKAVEMRASDVHFERYRTYVKVRYRIDGRLQTIKKLPVHLHSGLVTRVKILAKLKIDEKRVPQDGRFSLVHGDKKFDVRVSILPGYLGECLVMRLLQSNSDLFSLQNLGARDKDVQKLEHLLSIQNGIIVVAGPTGSGKSTTLYSIVKKISSPECKVITVEDPVEYQLEGINQVSVNEAIGMTFATALRSMLRQAPNIILVGEIRDKETAEIAIRAALTGHLVLSTVHAKDTVNAITRLLDLGIPAYLVAATLRGVLSQRLIRKLCPNCAREGKFDLASLKEIAPEYKAMGNEHIREPVGCDQCLNTGYKGRQAVMEILPVNEKIQRIINQRCDEDKLRQQAQSEGMETLRQIALEHYTHGEIGYEALLTLFAEMS
ncbi:MAG: GspE/PulE family protein [Puniceicoccales bacterium]|jgi:type II secretory ATPase GspE/PulE/Tfp pilus assembly ATPase PilB-like protein|nr:GspE/PulE family protein [Puniceicoccales bacterium]